MYLDFLGYFLIANNALEKYSGRFEYALYGPSGTMYLNSAVYFSKVLLAMAK